MPIRAVFFDLDGTLYARDALVGRVAAAQFESFRAQLPQIDRAEYVRRVSELDDHGHPNKASIYLSLGAELHLDTNLIEELTADFWRRYDEDGLIATDTVETLRTLRAIDLKLGVITNGTTNRQSRKLQALGIDSLFDVVLISEAEGIRKPDPEIFRRAMDLVGVEPSESVYIGDNPEADIVGALSAGMKAIWKRVPYWTMTSGGVSVINELHEILPICLGQSDMATGLG